MYKDEEEHNTRRRFLTAALTFLGGVGGSIASWPFISSMSPSTRAQAAGAPIEVDIEKLESGDLIREQWRGKPIWIVKRTPEMIKSLSATSSAVRDPNSDKSVQPAYAKNEYRSIKPEYLVLVGICTHLGCSPGYRPSPGSSEGMSKNWHGGFFCACHGSRFDLAGRVYPSVPAPTNLEVPPYRFVGDHKIIIGQSDKEVS